MFQWKVPRYFGQVVLDISKMALREEIDIEDHTNDVKICSISNYESFNFYDNYENEYLSLKLKANV